MSGADRVPGTHGGSRGAVFLLPLRATPGAAPVAAWATTGGWATGAERVLGSAWVITDSGTFDAAQTLGQVAPPVREGVDVPTPGQQGWRRMFRSAIPEPVITLVKDVRRAVQGRRRARAIEPEEWRERDLAFVWQRHAMFRRCGVRLARSLGAPLVVSVHAMQVEEAAGWGVKRPGWSRMAELIGELPQLRAADVVACVSDGVAESVRRRGIPEHRILVTPNGVDTERFHPGPPDPELRDRLGLKGRFVIGWSGSFRGFHGLDVALGAIARLQSDHDVALLLVGDGQQRFAIEARARHLGIRSLVMVGSVPFGDVPNYLRLCDIGLVLAPTSGTFHYSPVKLREYLACGLPVIAHEVGELASSLVDGQDALLVRRGDVSALVDALTRAISEPALRRRLSERGPELARTRWSWETPVRDVLARLTELEASEEGRSRHT